MIHTTDPHNSGEWEARDVVCLGCEAREQHGDPKRPGARTYLHNSMSDP